MMRPTIHLNGTSQADLLQQIIKVHRALHEAIGALREATPNARDYYPQGPEAFEKARAEHRRRVDAIVQVDDELMEIGETM